MYIFAEIICINENDMYLKTLVHEIGMQLHSVATCTQIQCFRYALFNMNSALLRKHWGLQNILDSIEQCHNILHENRDLLYQNNPILMNRDDLRNDRFNINSENENRLSHLPHVSNK